MTVNNIKISEEGEQRLWLDFLNSRPKNPWNGEPSLPSRKSNLEYTFRRYVAFRLKSEEDEYLSQCDAWDSI